MDRTDKIVLGVAFVVLLALLVYRPKIVSPLDVPISEGSLGDQSSGSLYLMGNMPWAYQPWNGHAAPMVTSGQVGQLDAFIQTQQGINYG